MKEDLKLRLNVQGEIGCEAGIDPSHLVVTTRSGLVVLSGTVRTSAEKLAAVRAAGRVSSVREVSDRIDVFPAPDRQPTGNARNIPKTP
jgi:osmotically-inducible protein OsmY